MGKDPYLCDYDQFYGYWFKITSDGDMSPPERTLTYFAVSHCWTVHHPDVEHYLPLTHELADLPAS